VFDGEMYSDDCEKKADKNLQLYMGEKRLIPGKKEVVKNIPPCVELDNSLQMKSIGFLDEPDKDQYFNMESEEVVADQLVSQAISEAQRVLAEDCDSDISEEPKDSECTGFLNTDINEPTNRMMSGPMSGDTRHLSSDTTIVCQKEVPKSEMDLEFTHQKELDLEGEPGWNEQAVKQTSLEDEVEDAMKGSKPEVVTEETTLTSSDGKIHDTRVVMKKKVHKKTTVKDGKEETIVTTDMHVEHDDKGPEDLQAAMKEIIENFVEGTGEFSSEPNEEK
jgi:hypothetical protein